MSWTAGMTIRKKKSVCGVYKMFMYEAVTGEKEIHFACAGHCPSDEFVRDINGNNIVCAIVSTIAQCCAVGCQLYADDYKELAMESGRCEFICSRSPQTEAIVKTALIGLDEAAEQYPSYVQEKR